MALILIADDTADIIDLLTDLLTARGHQVVSVVNGAQLIEKAKDWKPQLIVSDIVMPGAYGSSACKALQQDPETARIPVVFLTAVAPEQARKVIPLSSNVRLVFKPIDVPVFMQVLNELLPSEKK